MTTTNMIESEKTALHYKVIADTANQVGKVAKDLSIIYGESIFNKEKTTLRKKRLRECMRALKRMLED